MKKRGRKIKFDTKATEQIKIALTPAMAAELIEQAQAAGYDWHGGTIDFARAILFQALNDRKSPTQGGAADIYAHKP